MGSDGVLHGGDSFLQGFLPKARSRRHVLLGKGRKRLLQATFMAGDPQETCHGITTKKMRGNKKSRVSAPSRAPTRFEGVSAGAPLPQNLLFASQEGRREE